MTGWDAMAEWDVVGVELLCCLRFLLMMWDHVIDRYDGIRVFQGARDD